MSRIADKQNEERYLRYRYVCRKLYTYEKAWQKWIIIIGFIFYALGLIPNIKDNVYIQYLAIGWTLLTFFIDRRKSDIHNRAVIYQEYCDRQMFGLRLVPGLIEHANTILPESIEFIEQRNRKIEYEKMKSEQSKIPLKNWYTSLSGLPIESARVLAQDENVSWDLNQRKYYRIVIYVGIIIVIISTSITIHLTTKNYIDFILSIPIIKELLVILFDNNDSIDRAIKIKGEIGEVYQKIRNCSLPNDLEQIIEQSLSIQFHIYENRKYSIPVPDIIYKVFRRVLQKKSTSYINNMKAELLQAIEDNNEEE